MLPKLPKLLLPLQALPRPPLLLPPQQFHVSSSLRSYVEKYGVDGKISAGTKLEGVTESLDGRIHNIRASGAKLKIYDLHGEGTKVQNMANEQ